MDFVVPHSVGNPCVIYPLMAGYFERVGGLNIGKKGFRLIRGEELDLIGNFLAFGQHRFLTGIAVNHF